MQRPAITVKFRLYLSRVIAIFLLFSCSYLPVASDRIQNHESYYSIDFPFEKFNQTRLKIESKIGKILKHRGEAHLTVLTPPELKALSPFVTNTEIDSIASQFKLNEKSVELICIAKGQVGELATYFYVVKAQAALDFRKAIQKLVATKSKTINFEAEHYYPHITIGFTEKDLHEQDGIIKDSKLCL